MVYSEATLAVPLIAGYAYHKKAYEGAQSPPLGDAAGAGYGVSYPLAETAKQEAAGLILRPSCLPEGFLLELGRPHRLHS